MGRGRILNVAVVAVGFIGCLILLSALSQVLVLPDPATVLVGQDEAIARQPQISAVADTADKAISMLFSLQLGLTVLVGFVLQQMSPSDRRSLITRSLGGLFLLAMTAGLYVAYLSRLQFVHLSNYSIVRPRDTIEGLISYQGICVAVSAAAAVCLVMLWISAPSEKRGTT